MHSNLHLVMKQQSIRFICSQIFLQQQLWVNDCFQSDDKEIPIESLLKQVKYFSPFKCCFFGLFKVSTYFCAIITLETQENIWNSSVSGQKSSTSWVREGQF